MHHVLHYNARIVHEWWTLPKTVNHARRKLRLNSYFKLLTPRTYLSDYGEKIKCNLIISFFLPVGVDHYILYII